MDRYQGKPFLKLLEFYVLKAIDRLPYEQEELLRSMEPKLSNAFGESGSWDQMVAAKMEFPDTLPAKIREIWEAGCCRCVEQGVVPDAVEFTRQFVDTNFVPYN